MLRQEASLSAASLLESSQSEKNPARSVIGQMRSSQPDGIPGKI